MGDRARKEDAAFETKEVVQVLGADDVEELLVVEGGAVEDLDFHCGACCGWEGQGEGEEQVLMEGGGGEAVAWGGGDLVSIGVGVTEREAPWWWLGRGRAVRSGLKTDHSGCGCFSSKPNVPPVVDRRFSWDSLTILNRLG